MKGSTVAGLRRRYGLSRSGTFAHPRRCRSQDAAARTDRAASQYTHGIPNFAFAVTVSAPPVTPLFAPFVANGAGEPVLALADGDVAPAAVRPGGTAVTDEPSSTST